MKIFTQAFQAVSHNLPSSSAFLASCHCIFSSSIIPEILSNEDLSRKLIMAHEDDHSAMKLLKMFALSDTMQFGSMMFCSGEDHHLQEFDSEILSPLLTTKRYFSSTLQRCTIHSTTLSQAIVNILTHLSQVRSLKYLHLKFDKSGDTPSITISCLKLLKTFPHLETLKIDSDRLVISDEELQEFVSSSPTTMNSVRELEIAGLRNDLPTFLKVFPNLRSLKEELVRGTTDLNALVSTVGPNLTRLELSHSDCENFEALGSLTELQTLRLIFIRCSIPTLQFLQPLQHNLADLYFNGTSVDSPTEFRHLANLHLLRKLRITNKNFDDSCLENLANLTLLEDLHFQSTSITPKGLHHLQGLCNLRSLDFFFCKIGSTSSESPSSELDQLLSSPSFAPSLRNLGLNKCNLVDRDLKSIGRFKNSLEVLLVTGNKEITNEGVSYLKDLVNLKRLEMSSCEKVTDLSFLSNSKKLEHLILDRMKSVDAESFRVFCCGDDEKENSFPNLKELWLEDLQEVNDEVFEHFCSNENLQHCLRILQLDSLPKVTGNIFSMHISKLKGLQRLTADGVNDEFDGEEKVKELMLNGSLKNLEEDE